MESTIGRRELLAAAGALSVGATAGCIEGGGQDDGNGDTGEPEADDGTPGTNDGDTVTIGSPHGLTGRYSSVVPPIVDAIDLAEQQINEAGGVADYELEIDVRDSGWTVEEARPVIDKMLNVDQVPVIVGIATGFLEPLWDDLQDTGQPVVSGYPGSTFLDERGGDLGTPEDLSDDEWVWRTIASYSNRLIGMAYYLQEERDAETLAILTGSEPGDQSQANAMKDAWTGLGGSLIEEVTYRTDQSDFRTPLTQLYEETADAVYFSAPESDLAKIGQQWHELEYDQRDSDVVIANGAMSEDIWNSYFEGVYQASSTPSGPGKEAFEDEFESYSDEQPNVWTYANWDATIVSALAMERAHRETGEITRDAVERSIGPVARPGGTEVHSFEEGKAELEDGNEIDYQGAASRVNFDDYGNVSAAVNVQQFEEGGSTTVLETIPLERLEELQSDLSD